MGALKRPKLGPKIQRGVLNSGAEFFYFRNRLRSKKRPKNDQRTLEALAKESPIEQSTEKVIRNKRAQKPE